jgi:hypothetical protein
MELINYIFHVHVSHAIVKVFMTKPKLLKFVNGTFEAKPPTIKTWNKNATSFCWYDLIGVVIFFFFFNVKYIELDLGKHYSIHQTP